MLMKHLEKMRIIGGMDTQEIEQVWDSMSDSQKEIFRLGFHIGRKLGLQEAQEVQKPNNPNEGETNE